MIAQTLAPRKRFSPFSPVLRKSFHERPKIFGQIPASSPLPGATDGFGAGKAFQPHFLYDSHSFLVVS
jgi:hypothetical protein